MKKHPYDVKIFVSSLIPAIGIEMLKNEYFKVTTWDDELPASRDELIKNIHQSDALFCTHAIHLDETILYECRHLDIISQFGVGYDNIDIAAATKLGIPVSNTPGILNDATADIAFGLMIAVSRKMFFMHKKIINGEWQHFTPTSFLGMELKNKTLGVFGLGRIGMEMAKRCKGAYNMNIIYYNRNKSEVAEKMLDAKFVSFDVLLRESDVLSVHCILSNETKNIFNKTAFDKMKPTSLFINTSRGGVHNEADLIDALDKKKIWGAGLDVTNPEPMHKNNPLLNMENVAVLPHIGSATVEARNAMSRLAAENIISFYKKGIIPNIVNPEVLKGTL